MKFTVALALLSPFCLISSARFVSEAFVTDGKPAARAVRKHTTLDRHSPVPQQRLDTSLPVSSFFQNELKRISETLDVESRDSNSADLVGRLTNALSLSKKEIGLLVLFTVPVAWGTYACTVQSIYALEPKVPGFLFSTCYFFVAATGSVMATLWNNNASAQRTDLTKSIPVTAGLELGFYVYLANFLHVIGLQSVPSDRAGFLFQLTTVMVPMLEAFFARDLLAIPPSTWLACALALAGIFVMGMEWPFGGAEIAPTATAAMQTMEEMSSFISEDGVTDLVSVASTVDTRAPFMATADLITPDSAQVLADSSTAMADSVNPLMNTLLSGDSLIIGAAFLYALQILRISKWTAEYSPLQIMTGKTMAESFFSILFVASTTWFAKSGMDTSSSNGALQYLQNSGQQTIDFIQSVTQGFSEGTISSETVEHFTGACLWTGLVTTCYLVFAQSFGQQHVKASEANLIYSLQPLFTAIFAYYMLGETLQPMGYIGGALIGGGVYLVASKSLSAKT